MAIDPHKVLGIDASASIEEATKAYKRLAKKYHPDKPDGNEDKFKEIGEALHQIKNLDTTSQRYKFDDQGFKDVFSQYNARSSGHPFEGFHFKEPTRRLQYNVTLEEAFEGFKLKDRSVPAGLHEGMRLHVPSSEQYGSDTVYTFIYKPHKRFVVSGHDLLMEVDIPFLRAVLGGSADITTICGKSLKVTIPKLSSSRTKLKVAGFGMNTKPKQERGDLIIRVNPIVPSTLTAEEEVLYRRIDALSSSK